MWSKCCKYQPKWILEWAKVDPGVGNVRITKGSYTQILPLDRRTGGLEWILEWAI